MQVALTAWISVFQISVSLFSQASAYGEAFDPNIKVEVFGDVDAAKKLIAKEEDTRTENLSESDNDQDQPEVSDDNLD